MQGSATLPTGTTNRDFFTVDGKDICRICIDPSDHPVYEHRGDERIFWWRTPVGTDRIGDEREREQVIARRWPR